MTIPGGISLTAPTVRRTPPGGTGLLHDLPPVSQPASETAPPQRFDAVEPPTIPRYFTNLVPGANGRAPAPDPAPTPPASAKPAISVISRAREVPASPAAPEVEPESPASRNLTPQTPEQAAARGLAEARALLQHDDQTDPYYVRTPTQRHARSRWLVLVVVLAAGVLLAGTVGKRYLAKYTKGSSLAASQADATVTALLAEGERSLARGDLQAAQDAFGKASARAENDRQVLTALATLEVLRADLLWLKQRLLEAHNDPAREQNARELARQVVRVRGVVERTKLVAPEGAATARLLVHAKRLSGEVAEARRHVAALTEDASLPENAYALAALDMADQAPVWSSIVHRLRISAEAEGPVGLSRAALVYALARSEQADAAKSELEKLAKANPSHPLIFDLRAFLDQAPAPAAGGEPSPDAPAADAADAGEAAGNDVRAGVGGDFRAQLKQAYAAAEKGQLATAERLYNAVLAKQPGNTEALSGLADVAHRRNDTGKSAQLYEEVLRKNPSYLPALMASADQKWASGDHAGAAGLYRRILEQAGADSSYGRRSAQRIAQAEFEASAEHDPDPVTEPSTSHGSESDAPSPAPDEPAAPETAPAAPAPPESGEAQPHIDTTDLPDLNQ